MTVEDLFNKHTKIFYHIDNEKGIELMDKERFIAALSEAIEDGHLQPMVMPGREEADGLGKATFCTWKEDEERNWWCDCDNTFCIYEGSPYEIGMKFCCYCGKPLKESRSGDCVER